MDTLTGAHAKFASHFHVLLQQAYETQTQPTKFTITLPHKKKCMYTKTPQPFVRPYFDVTCTCRGAVEELKCISICCALYALMPFTKIVPYVLLVFYELYA